MIQLTRLNGEGMLLNSDLIRYAEANPDTVITLVTGEKIVVSESCMDLVSRVIEYRSGLLRSAFSGLQAGSQIVDEGTLARETAISAKVAGNAVELVNAKIEAEADSDKSWRRRQRDND